MIHIQDIDDYYKQFNLITEVDLQNIKSQLSELDLKLNTVSSSNPIQNTSYCEISDLRVDIANIDTLINPQLRQLEFEISKLKDRISIIENRRQQETEKDIVYIMGE